MRNPAERLLRLPTYVFARLDELKTEARSRGVDLIDLGMGNPDLPPPKVVIDAMVEALKDGRHHRYPSFDGLPAFNKAISEWMERQYGVHVNPKNEVVPLIGSKEGLVHFAFAFIDSGDTTLVPLPAYPAHFRGTILANGSPIVLPTHERSHFIPNLKLIDENIARRAKLFILSYPTNPTAATAPREFFEEAVAFAIKHNLILIHDFAYAEIYFDGAKPQSMLSIPGAKDVCIEFHTFSKTFSMPGWRCGFAVGNPELIATLNRLKTNVDYGLFMAIQQAAIAALKLTDKDLQVTRDTYQRRRDIFVAGLKKLGWPVTPPKATMYIWVPVPRGYNSTDFSLHVLDKTGVVIAPGTAFGDLGEGYVRIALVDNEERLKEALNRMEKAKIHFE